MLQRADAPPVVELSGPAAVITADVARELSSLLRRAVSPQYAPLDAVVPTFTAMGVSEDGAQRYRAFYEALANGHMVPEDPATRIRGEVGLRDGLARLLG